MPPRKTKKGKRQNNNDGDVTEANILPVSGRRSATKKARTETQEEEFQKEIDDLAEVLAIVENVDHQFDEMADGKQEEEEEQEEVKKSEDPPSNQEQNELIKARERETRKAAAQSLGNELAHMIMYYMNRLHFNPDTFKAFYCPENDMVPWVGRPKHGHASPF